MYIIIAGAGKVGWNLARELIGEGHEVTLLESDRNRYLIVEEELEHRVQHGDATELWVLERAGMKIVLGVVAGIVVAFLCVAGIETVGHLAFPPPPGTDLTDPAQVARIMENWSF